MFSKFLKNFSYLLITPIAICFLIFLVVPLITFAETVVISPVPSLYEKLQGYLFCGFLILGALTVIASFLSRLALAIAKMTKSPDDDIEVTKFISIVNTMSEFMLELCQIFPTLGVNPKTQQMKNELELLKSTQTGQNGQNPQ